MKKKYFGILALILLSGFTVRVHAQVPDLDSLQKKILEMMQQEIKKEGAPESLIDTSKVFSGKLPVNLDVLFKEVNKEISSAKSKGDTGEISGGYFDLSRLDSMSGNYKSAYENYKLYTLYRDSLQKRESERKELLAKMQYEFDKKQAVAKAEQEKRDAESRRVRNLQYFAMAGLTVLLLVILLIALTHRRNSKQRKKANILLQAQKEKVESTLSELRSAQVQLIHAEKMASLGELTAGVAHEIQNPLNFVNNFSEINEELVEELKSGLATNNQQLTTELAEEIKANSRKISHHGKRADAIVKGMLQHSRSGSGQKEPTDLNALCDEYLRLAYHGLRAKDSTFNAAFEMHADPSIPRVNVVPQDIGRVLINLINNAFYAVHEKAKQGIPGYEPTVILKTSMIPPLGDRGAVVEISVKDNGPGIPDAIKEKIFQPFFTTKPTGEGTGLGLSLSYDIVKAHGGEINVKSGNGEGTEFFIQLIR